MNVIQEVSKWAKSAPKWQSDAIRRIFTQEQLTAKDEEVLFELLLHENGLNESCELSPDRSARLLARAMNQEKTLLSRKFILFQA